MIANQSWLELTLTYIKKNNNNNGVVQGCHIDEKLPVETGAVNTVFQGYVPFSVAQHFQ